MAISRRSFLEALVVLSALYVVAPISLVPSKVVAGAPLQRPPGALPEKEFNFRCIRCLRCGQSCRTGAIHFGDWFTLAELDTPFVDPEACTLCLECIEVCPTAALQEELVDFTAYPALAPRTVFYIATQSCVLYKGRKRRCLECYDACPRKGKALKLNSNGKPYIDEKYCTGCGICQRVCPYNAIFPRGDHL